MNVNWGSALGTQKMDHCTHSHLAGEVRGAPSLMAAQSRLSIAAGSVLWGFEGGGEPSYMPVLSDLA